MKRWVPWITGIVVIGGMIWTFFYLKDMHPLGSRGTKLGKDHLAGVGIRFKDAKLIGRSQGKKVWALQAGIIDISKDRRLATFRGETKGSLLQDGKKVAGFSASETVYNTFTRNIMTPGYAELKLENGPSFKVHKIYWNSEKSKLVCQEGIEAVLEGSTMHGERMTADLRTKELTVEKVTGKIRIENEIGNQ